ncbi:MAG TPA: hypothetical protein VME22_09835 [Solirubrobacteraceae bacterium]|nr:hypothetical protein [Solirubrobacteraceae bacterium]
MPLIVMFGVADGLGTLLGITLHWNVSDSASNIIEFAFMAGLGVYWLGVAVISKRMRGTAWIWALPWILTVDNITYGTIDHAWSHAAGVQALETGLSSAIQAAIGIAVSVALAKTLPRLIDTVRGHRAGGGAVIATSGGSGVAPLESAVATERISPAVVPAIAGVLMIAAAFANLLWG